MPDAAQVVVCRELARQRGRVHCLQDPLLHLHQELWRWEAQPPSRRALCAGGALPPDMFVLGPDITTELAYLTRELKADPCVAHALALRAAWALGNYHRFFRLYCHAPCMSGYLVDKFADRERRAALKAMIKTYVVLCSPALCTVAPPGLSPPFAPRLPPAPVCCSPAPPHFLYPPCASLHLSPWPLFHLFSSSHLGTPGSLSRPVLLSSSVHVTVDLALLTSLWVLGFPPGPLPTHQTPYLLLA